MAPAKAPGTFDIFKSNQIEQPKESAINSSMVKSKDMGHHQIQVRRITDKEYLVSYCDDEIS
jgi:hypothetical protein